MADIPTNGFASKDEKQWSKKNRLYVVLLEPKCFHLHAVETFPIIPCGLARNSFSRLYNVRPLYRILLPIKGELESWHAPRKQPPGFLSPTSHRLPGRSVRSRLPAGSWKFLNSY